MTRDLISATGLMMALLLSCPMLRRHLRRKRRAPPMVGRISRDTGLPPGVRCASLKRPATLR